MPNQALNSLLPIKFDLVEYYQINIRVWTWLKQTEENDLFCGNTSKSHPALHTSSNAWVFHPALSPFPFSLDTTLSKPFSWPAATPTASGFC